jgi:chromosome segregation ATPase
MAKLSNIFGRKSEDVSGTRANEPHPAETLADVGSRIGEENEALRSLLGDTARKIDELDELKESFGKIVAPFNNALRALEQEKSHAQALAGMLDESRTAYETLRTEFYRVDKQATAAGAEAEKLRVDLELAHEANRALETTTVELSNEISDRRAQANELEHQLTHEATERRTLTENHRVLQAQYDAAEKRIVELEGEVAHMREKLALLDDDKRSLQVAVDKSFDEAARLGHALTESENALAATRAQLGKMESNFAETYAERGQLAVALDEIREQRQAEQNSLNMRLEGLQSRAATAERLLAEARQNLILRTEEVRAFDRKAVEATIARNNAEKRLAQAEGMHEMRESHVKDVEKARAALAERTNAMTKTLKSREAALVRAEERLAALTERNGHLEADVQVIRTSIEKRVEELNSALQRERMEHAMVAGALEATRKDNARLQSEVASLRSILRRGMALDEPPVAPDQPANDEASVKAKAAGKSAESA